jgi:hypothetical protein
MSLLPTALAHTAVAWRSGLSTWITRMGLPASRRVVILRGASAESRSVSLSSFPTSARKARLSARKVMLSIS